MRLWLDSAVSHNDTTSVLEFADASLAKGHFWTLAELMDKTLEGSRISTSQRFVAQATRCVALARIRETKERSDSAGTDLATAQKRWAAARLSDETLRGQIREGVDAAQQTFTGVDQPTREQWTLKRHLDTLEQKLLENRGADNEGER